MRDMSNCSSKVSSFGWCLAPAPSKCFCQWIWKDLRGQFWEGHLFHMPIFLVVFTFVVLSGLSKKTGTSIGGSILTCTPLRPGIGWILCQSRDDTTILMARANILKVVFKSNDIKPNHWHSINNHHLSWHLHTFYTKDKYIKINYFTTKIIW